MIEIWIPSLKDSKNSSTLHLLILLELTGRGSDTRGVLNETKQHEKNNVSHTDAHCITELQRKENSWLTETKYGK